MEVTLPKRPTNFQKSHFNCPICEDKGWLFFTDEQGYESVSECICQKQKRIQQRFRISGIAPDELEQKTLETFKTDTEEAKKMKDLAEKYLKDENALGIGYFGKSGTGKTHICIAICNELIKQDRDVKYFQYRTEMQKLLRNYYKDVYEELLYNINQIEVLYIDDFLKFSKSSKGEILENELRIVYDIINYRYLNKMKTIFSSEYTASEIVNDIDVALGSRIYSMVKPYGMKCNGENRRLINGN